MMIEDESRRIAEALIETISAHADGHPLFEDNQCEQFECGPIRSGLALVGGKAEVVPQISMRVTVDGREFLVQATALPK